jgi:hypothetical protein
MWLMYSLHNNEYRMFKPVEITVKRGLKERRKLEGMNQFGI